MTASNIDDMARAQFTCRYIGSAVDDGGMPVEDLAPAMLGLAETFRAASSIVAPERGVPELKIVATGVGSFTVGLALTAPTLIGQVADVITGHSATTLDVLREVIIGTVATAAGTGVVAGLVALVKRFRGRDAVVETEHGDGTVTLLSEDGDQVIVPKVVWDLYRDRDVRRGLEKATKPVRVEGVDAIEFKNEGHVEVVTTEDAEAFTAVPGEETIGPQELEMFLGVESVDFGGRKWRLLDSDGNSFRAAIADEVFNERVSAGREAFKSGDVIRAVVEFTQTMRPGQKTPTTERTVVRVIKHEPGPSPDDQQSLDVP